MNGFTPGPAPNLPLVYNYTFLHNIAPDLFVVVMMVVFIFMFGPRNGLILIACMPLVIYVANHFDRLSALAIGG